MSPEQPRVIAPAPFMRRIAAITVDIAVCIVLASALPGIVSNERATLVGLALAVIYFVVRDSFWGGRSLGKRVAKLRVLNVTTLLPGGIRESFRRNGLFVFYCVLALVLNTMISILFAPYPLDPGVLVGFGAATFFAYRYVESAKRRTKMDMFGETVVVVVR
jgi:hypothetical protein